MSRAHPAQGRGRCAQLNDNRTRITLLGAPILVLAALGDPVSLAVVFLLGLVGLPIPALWVSAVHLRWEVAWWDLVDAERVSRSGPRHP